MKKYLLTLLIVFATFNFSQAQSDIRFGVTLNPGMSWYKPDNAVQKSDGVRFAFTYGLVVDYKFGADERYAINTGLQIGMAGGRMSSTGESVVLRTAEDPVISTIAMAARVQYLELPISLKLRSNETEPGIVYYGQIGFINGFPFRKRADLSVDEVKQKNIELKNVEFFPDSIQKVVPYHFGLLIEAGVEYVLNDKTSIVGGIYFNNGFTNVFKDSNDDRVVMRNFGLRIGVLF